MPNYTNLLRITHPRQPTPLGGFIHLQDWAFKTGILNSNRQREHKAGGLK